MKFFLIFIFMCIQACIHAQDLNLSFEQTDSGFNIYADNVEYCPVSLQFNFQLLNLTYSDEDIIVVPTQSKKYKIGELHLINKQQNSSYTYTYKTVFGDVTNQNIDKDYIYDLPFVRGKQFIINQGYQGNFTHKDEDALDFDMPEGTDVAAARDGIIIKVVQSFKLSCGSEECIDSNNYILIYHPDGTVAEYAHLLYNGSLVKPGDKVSKGDIIAKSGNTGWSTGPHLHFECFIPSLLKWNSVETKFRIDEGFTAVLLKEKNAYKRGY